MDTTNMRSVIEDTLSGEPPAGPRKKLSAAQKKALKRAPSGRVARIARAVSLLEEDPTRSLSALKKLTGIGFYALRDLRDNLVAATSTPETIPGMRKRLKALEKDLVGLGVREVHATVVGDVVSWRVTKTEVSVW